MQKARRNAMRRRRNARKHVVSQVYSRKRDEWRARRLDSLSPYYFNGTRPPPYVVDGKLFLHKRDALKVARGTDITPQYPGSE